MLSLRQIAKRFDVGTPECSMSITVLRGVDLDVPRGTSIGLFGARGSGKTTLLLCAAGLLRADAGHVRASAPVMYRSGALGLSADDVPMSDRIYLLDDPLRGIDGISYS